ncbi:DUF7287 family protein [Natrinema altunense]|uniref:Uncharacterized protein n=1 Tax=Natrinema altunense TaxID=222984 RepID=A0A482XWR9_9EURY|nr:hypothetical protein [Natrinema altunense]RZH67572.1 hypothetical protein ELS17_11990 [Natrinema altunense]
MSEQRSRDRERDRQRRPRTISISLADRGQTTQDFAVGIGVFLLAIAFVFSFLPSLVTPYESSNGAKTAQADRIADRIVDDLGTGSGNEIDFTEYAGEENLTHQLGLRASGDQDHVYDSLNVTIKYVNNSTTLKHPDTTAGEPYSNQSAASSARIVTLEGDVDECDPACRLVVRVW